MFQIKALVYLKEFEWINQLIMIVLFSSARSIQEVFLRDPQLQNRLEELEELQVVQIREVFGQRTSARLFIVNT